MSIMCSKMPFCLTKFNMDTGDICFFHINDPPPAGSAKKEKEREVTLLS